MKIHDILTPERTYSGVSLKSKKKVLEFAAETIARTYPGLFSEDIFETLCARERLGSTALGHGVALPHARLPFLQEPLGLLIRLREGVSFDSEDNTPVDLIFVLVVPQTTTDLHLQLLAQIAEIFSQAEFRESLRKAATSEVLYELATS
ncbi:MAG: PTS sugar transporter subunit IIA [Gammaproteobacteria bacterium]